VRYDRTAAAAQKAGLLYTPRWNCRIKGHRERCLKPLNDDLLLRVQDLAARNESQHQPKHRSWHLRVAWMHWTVVVLGRR